MSVSKKVSINQDGGTPARILHEEMSHTITSLLASLAKVSIADAGNTGSTDALQRLVANDILILKKDQRCLGIFQGIQMIEELNQMRSQTEVKMRELESVTYHRDASCHQATLEQSHTHLAAMARQEMEILTPEGGDDRNAKVLDDDERSSTHAVRLIHSYLKEGSSIKSSEADGDFDFLDPIHHANNLNTLLLEKQTRQSLLQELEQITIQKQQVIQRIASLKSREIQLKTYLDSIEKAIEPLKQMSLVFSSTSDG